MRRLICSSTAGNTFLEAHRSIVKMAATFARPILLRFNPGKRFCIGWTGGNKVEIADASEEGTYEFTIHAGKNFIVLEGELFTGSLTLNVSQNSSKRN